MPQAKNKEKRDKKRRDKAIEQKAEQERRTQKVLDRATKPRPRRASPRKQPCAPYAHHMRTICAPCAPACAGGVPLSSCLYDARSCGASDRHPRTVLSLQAHTRRAVLLSPSRRLVSRKCSARSHPPGGRASLSLWTRTTPRRTSQYTLAESDVSITIIILRLNARQPDGLLPTLAIAMHTNFAHTV